jgi:hypothetical protein
MSAMRCRLWSLLLCGASIVVLSGCTAFDLGLTHSSESRVISAFIENLEKADLEELKGVASTDFNGAALRHEKSLDSIKMLNIPEGKVKVVEVKEKGDEEKRVLVKVGERERKMYFDLIYDSTKGKWVVDDVEFKKNLKPGQVNKSVTEQMDLLLSIQEFLDAWEAGERSQILATSTPDLRRCLEPLPPQSLKQFTAKITADLKRDSIKPEVEGHASMAIVNLKRKGGGILLTMRLEEEKWLADDIAVQSKKEEGSISSVRKHAQVLMTAIHFCEAYQTDNKAGLEKTSQTRFFRSTLQSADLSKVPLSIKQPDQEDFEVKLMASRAEVLVKRPDHVIHLTLSQGPAELDMDGKPIESSAETGKPFLVEEVTFHEISTKQQKRLSAIFSSQSLVMVFAEALANSDLKSLRLESTTDFQNRVWARVELDDMADLSLEQIEQARPVILDTAFKGPLTEVTVNQGSTPLTYVLRDQNGRLLVDDVLVPALDRPNSLKMNLEVQIPLRNFAKGLRTGDMRLVRDNASREFNKLVFQSMNRLPKIQSDPAPFLAEPLTGVQLTTDRAVLKLGDQKYGATIHMAKEGDHFKIEDIVMISGVEQSQRKGLMQSLRQMVLSGTRFGNAAAKNPIMPHGLDETDDLKPAVLSSDRKRKQDSEGEMDVPASLGSHSIRRVGATRQIQPDRLAAKPRGGRSFDAQDDMNVGEDLRDSRENPADIDSELDDLVAPRSRRMPSSHQKAKVQNLKRASDDLDLYGTSPEPEAETEPGMNSLPTGTIDHREDADVIQPRN